MLTLLSRELQDHFIHVVLTCLITAMAIATAILVTLWSAGEDGSMLPATWSLVVFVLLFYSLGALQMYVDRVHRVSSFLATLAATRTRILAAKVLFGILVILLALVPLLITAIAILNLSPPPVALYGRVIVDISVAAALTFFACYCIGLLAGWTSSLLVPVLGGPALVGMVVPLVVIKGFGPELAGLLLLFIVASLACVWHRFTSTSL